MLAERPGGCDSGHQKGILVEAALIFELGKALEHQRVGEGDHRRQVEEGHQGRLVVEAQTSAVRLAGVHKGQDLIVVEELVSKE